VRTLLNNDTLLKEGASRWVLTTNTADEWNRRIELGVKCNSLHKLFLVVHLHITIRSSKRLVELLEMNITSSLLNTMNWLQVVSLIQNLSKPFDTTILKRKRLISRFETKHLFVLVFQKLPWFPVLIFPTFLSTPFANFNKSPNAFLSILFSSC